MISRRQAVERIWKATLFGIFIPEFVEAQVFVKGNPRMPINGASETLQQSQTSSDTDLNVGENGPDRTFSLTQITAASTYTITKLEFQLRKTASAAQTIDARIFSDNSVPNDPLALLATSTNTLAASTIVADTYYRFTFSGLPFVSGTKYWIGMKATPIDGGQFPIWRAIQGSGRTEYGDVSASTWSQYTGNPHAGTYKIYSG